MTQQQAYDEFIPYINDVGKIYRKISPVFARIAKEGEYVETWTDDGLETTNYAKEGDFVVKNLHTECQEEYIVPPDMLFSRYKFFYYFEKGAVYIPQGKILACRYYGSELEFIAKWGRLMSLKPGDYIVSPSPNYQEVYRIASQEFFETYEKIINPDVE